MKIVKIEKDLVYDPRIYLKNTIAKSKCSASVLSCAQCAYYTGCEKFIKC